MDNHSPTVNPNQEDSANPNNQVVLANQAPLDNNQIHTPVNTNKDEWDVNH